MNPVCWDVISENAIPYDSGIICERRQRLEAPYNRGGFGWRMIRLQHCSHWNELVDSASRMQISGNCRLEFIVHTELIERLETQ
jgi:hypothetical protein